MSVNPLNWICSVSTLSSLLAGPCLAQTEAGQDRFLSRARQLTFEGRRGGEGYFAPDGKSLVFQSEREPGNPFYQIYLLDLETGDTRRISPGLGKTTCAYFRPGTDELLFASTHLDPEARSKQRAEIEFRASGKERRYAWDYDDHMDIFLARRDGSNLDRLTDSPGYDAEAAFSPDGSKIVFCSLRSAYPTNQLSAEDWKRLETDPAWFGEIYLMNADGSAPRRLTTTPGYDGGPFFMPDGERIVWRRFDTNGLNADVYTMNLDGSDTRRLTDFGSMSWAPFGHPSGRYVVFTSNKHGFSNFELFIVDTDGAREPVRVTFTDGFDGLPVFSPDGNRLCWTSNRTGDKQSQLFLAEWDHAAAMAALAEAPRVSGTGPRAEVSRETPSLESGANLGRVEFSPELTLEDLQSAVGTLAADSMEGRMTGSAGATQAAEYLARRLREVGLVPLPGASGYFQEFTFQSGVRVITNENRLAVLRHEPVAGAQTFEVERDYRPLSLSANGEVEAEVAFAGYGLHLSGGPGGGYDSYAGLDVSNKVVLVLRYVPEAVSPERRQELNRYAGLRYKALIARERGAKGILFVTGPNSPNAGELIPMDVDSSLAGSGIMAVTLGNPVAEALLSGSGKDLKTLQSALDDENPHAEPGFLLPGVKVSLKTALEHLRKSDRNVLAMVPTAGVAPVSASWILLGAHYDHLGYGQAGAMLRKGEENQIHPGADDNASGTAVVLEMAARVARDAKRTDGGFRRGLVVAFWSGEEIGLIGSSHFAEHAPVPISNVVAYLNFDMVGRMRDNKLTLQGVGSSDAWRRQIEKRNVAAGFDLVLQDDPYLPTDTTALYPKGVPVLNFFTGSHDDYHRPTDRAETLDYEGMLRIAQFALGITLDLLQAPSAPAYVRVERSGPAGGSRDALRVYLGTIPDYATEVTGVKLSGVRAGGPADKAGLKGGDVIVEFAGQKVANIYDYTYALDAVKIGQPVKVIVLRESARVELTVVPEAR